MPKKEEGHPGSAFPYSLSELAEHRKRAARFGHPSAALNRWLVTIEEAVAAERLAIAAWLDAIGERLQEVNDRDDLSAARLMWAADQIRNQNRGIPLEIPDIETGLSE